MGIGPKSTVKEIRSNPLTRVWIYPKAYYLMSLWARLAGKQKYEFTCLGRAIERDGDIIITDAYAVKHEGSSGAVDMDDDAQIQLMIKLDSEGFDGCLVDTKGRVDPSEIRCWTHSHPGAGPSATFWSSIDDNCIERFLTGDWCVAVVFDENGDNPKCRIDMKSPRMQIAAELQLYVQYLSEEEEKAATELFKQTSSKTGYSYSGTSRSYPYAGGRGPYSSSSSSRSSSSSSSSSRSGRSFSAKSSTSSSSKSKDEDDAVAQNIKERIMSLFDLREDQVEPDWIDWCEDSHEDFGEFSVGVEDDDDAEGVRSIAYYEDPDPTELAEFEAEVEGEEGQTRIPFVEDDDVEWASVTEIDGDGNEVVSEASEDEGAETEDAEADDNEVAAEAAEDEGSDEVEEDVNVHHDTIPDADTPTMSEGELSRRLDDLGQSVLDNELKVEVALAQAQSDLGLSPERAESELRERLGG